MYYWSPTEMSVLNSELWVLAGEFKVVQCAEVHLA